jgi:hypothetical protein
MPPRNALADVAPAFVEMAHRIVWASVASVDAQGRPWSRILHPLWQWDGASLEGTIATEPTAIKRAHLAAHPYLSVNYWTPTHDTCLADCHAEWLTSAEAKQAAWQRFLDAPEPVGYDPAIIPAWAEGPTAPAFGVLRLTPWRLRVMPAPALEAQAGNPAILLWSDRGS